MHSGHDTEAGRAALRIWLFSLAFLIFCMVIVGGAVRLTDSGLSITEWQPLLGAIPPLTEADWAIAFEKYRQIPEYALVNNGMSLDDFKFIYWWEWSHRLLGRLIGAAFLLPFLFFWIKGYLTRALAMRLAVIFVLGGLQGALGWYMVASGLSERVDVSQYRLAAHLVLATIIFGAIIWVALGLGKKRRPIGDIRPWFAMALVGLVIAQVGMGGFVAGIDAGMGYNTWPLMDGRLIPNGLWVMSPAWRNIFENALTVQFFHRLIAYVIALCVLIYAWRQRSSPALVLLAIVFLQITFGILTLLHQVPLSLALIHQGGALILLATALWNLHSRLVSRSPALDRQ
ncbi:MAG: COX15/CtaA family protein [Hyphomicrobiales bacterium]